MASSLTATDDWQVIAVPGADVTLLLHAPLSLPHESLFAALQSELPWREEPITLFGKTMMQPRLVAWFGDDHCSYTASQAHNQMPARDNNHTLGFRMSTIKVKPKMPRGTALASCPAVL